MLRRPLVLVLALAPLAAQVAPDQLGQREVVGQGVGLRRGEAKDPAGRPQCLAVLDVDPDVEGVRFELALAEGLEPTTLLAARGGAVAAINGGFFTKERLPEGTFRLGGRTVSAPHSWRTQAIVLSASGALALSRDPKGEFKGFPDVMTAGPMLLENGKPPEHSWSAARHPRSAIGVDAQGRVLLLALDGRTERAAGMTLDELAATMAAFGCRSALNLDGGGSTTLWLSGWPEGGIVNHPCDNKQFDAAGERAVANALLVFTEPAAGEPGLDATERDRRTARDFRLTRDELLAQLKRRVRDFRPEELDEWISKGLVDRGPDGQGFAGATVSNLFFRDAAVRARRLQGRTWSPPLTETGKLVFDVHVTLSVDADAVPPGETVRAWLPFPQEYEHQRVLSAEHAAAAAPMRSVYLEQPAVAGEPTVFTTSYRVERTGVQSGPLDVGKAQLPASRAFTEMCPPHVVPRPELLDLAKQVAGDETNPLLVARALYDWCAANLGYSYAREYSTIGCIPAEVLRTRRGDCGQHTLLFMTLCRLRGIPARWQSGWVIRPGDEGLHDWCEIRVEPWGWLPVDVNTAVETNHADGLSAERRAAILDFAFGNLDTYRLVVNRDHGRPLVPAKRSPRSDDVDFQRGEVEWGTPAHNVYYDRFDYALRVEIVK